MLGLPGAPRDGAHARVCFYGGEMSNAGGGFAAQPYAPGPQYSQGTPPPSAPQPSASPWSSFFGGNPWASLAMALGMGRPGMGTGPMQVAPTTTGGSPLAPSSSPINTSAPNLGGAPGSDPMTQWAIGKGMLPQGYTTPLTAQQESNIIGAGYNSPGSPGSPLTAPLVTPPAPFSPAPPAPVAAPPAPASGGYTAGYMIPGSSAMPGAGSSAPYNPQTGIVDPSWLAKMGYAPGMTVSQLQSGSSWNPAANAGGGG